MENSCKITEALATLRSELVELRNQDVQLMKQMVNINDTIAQIKKRRQQSRKCDIMHRTSTMEQTTPLILHENIFTSRRGSDCDSISSSEEIYSSSEDLSTCSEDSFDRSFSSGCSINYEDILNKNIKLWKHSKSISSGSLNSLC